MFFNKFSQSKEIVQLRRKKSLGTKENVEVIGNSILIGKQGIKLYSSLKKKLEENESYEKVVFFEPKIFVGFKWSTLGWYSIKTKTNQLIVDKVLAIIHIIWKGNVKRDFFFVISRNQIGSDYLKQENILLLSIFSSLSIYVAVELFFSIKPAHS